jgi:hypothetical protein
MEKLVESHGNLPHRDAMRLTAATDLRLALLYETPYSEAIVPLKLYNYLAMPGPILAVMPEHGRAAEIVRETRMGKVVGPAGGADAVYAALREYYDAWRAGKSVFDPDPVSIARFDSSTQTRALADVLRNRTVPPCR